MDGAFRITKPELIELWKAFVDLIGVVDFCVWIGSAVFSNQGISSCIGFLVSFEVGGLKPSKGQDLSPVGMMHTGISFMYFCVGLLWKWSPITCKGNPITCISQHY